MAHHEAVHLEVHLVVFHLNLHNNMELQATHLNHLNKLAHQDRLSHHQVS